MADPPPYDGIVPGSKHISGKTEYNTKSPQSISIREEVGATRTQHVAAVASNLLPHIQQRARQGLSKSSLLLLPLNQKTSHEGQLVGYPEDELPILVNLEGSLDTKEFWSQKEVLQMLKSELMGSLSDESSAGPSRPIESPQPQSPKAPKSSFWGRRTNSQSSAPVQTVNISAQPPVVVDVQWDEAHFRSETDYGLYDTSRVRCVSLIVEIK